MRTHAEHIWHILGLSSPLKPQKKKLGQPKSMSILLYVKAQHVLNNYNLERFNERLHPQQ
jgi:hypothetical protein